MATRWILIANGGEAGLYAGGPRPGELSLIRKLQHPESRAKNRDLTTDINGRKPGGGVQADGRPGAEPDTQPKEVERQRFARELAEQVHNGLLQHSYGTLVIAAPPHLLGLIRGSLSSEVSKHVELTIDKDLTHLDERALASALEEALRV